MSTMTGAGIGLGMGSSMAVAGLTDTPLGLATAVTVPTTMILAIFGARLLTLRSCARNA
ncbi:hypothetical protein G7066_14285 [Leucobacter coleopterorum]|uniref:Uncharacterized protein n=1 Tax=Leucobacter coleopterorum TaxID=2714933 RepID=A0ABX6JYQ5_9MICO|nr:hypothetical protein [Leucobacter coleopterorum]QIM19446.1 hypothetical protein G7066_14285 [Leucobacter coleopterorum]